MPSQRSQWFTSVPSISRPGLKKVPCPGRIQYPCMTSASAAASSPLHFASESQRPSCANRRKNGIISERRTPLSTSAARGSRGGFIEHATRRRSYQEPWGNGRDGACAFAHRTPPTCVESTEMARCGMPRPHQAAIEIEKPIRRRFPNPPSPVDEFDIPAAQRPCVADRRFASLIGGMDRDESLSSRTDLARVVTRFRWRKPHRSKVLLDLRTDRTRHVRTPNRHCL